MCVLTNILHEISGKVLLDMFNSTHNQKGLDHKALLEHLKDKDPAYYYTDILVPNGRTLSDFIFRR